MVPAQGDNLLTGESPPRSCNESSTSIDSNLRCAVRDRRGGDGGAEGRVGLGQTEGEHVIAVPKKEDKGGSWYSAGRAAFEPVILIAQHPRPDAGCRGRLDGKAFAGHQRAIVSRAPQVTRTGQRFALPAPALLATGGREHPRTRYAAARLDSRKHQARPASEEARTAPSSSQNPKCAAPWASVMTTDLFGCSNLNPNMEDVRRMARVSRGVPGRAEPKALQKKDAPRVDVSGPPSRTAIMTQRKVMIGSYVEPVYTSASD